MFSAMRRTKSSVCSWTSVSPVSSSCAACSASAASRVRLCQLGRLREVGQPLVVAGEAVERSGERVGVECCLEELSRQVVRSHGIGTYPSRESKSWWVLIPSGRWQIGRVTLCGGPCGTLVSIEWTETLPEPCSFPIDASCGSGRRTPGPCGATLQLAPAGRSPAPPALASCPAEPRKANTAAGVVPPELAIESFPHHDAPAHSRDAHWAYFTNELVRLVTGYLDSGATRQYPSLPIRPPLGMARYCTLMTREPWPTYR